MHEMRVNSNFVVLNYNYLEHSLLFVLFCLFVLFRFVSIKELTWSLWPEPILEERMI